MPDAPDPTDATPDADGTADRQEHAGGFTINLASGVAPGSRPRKNRKSAAPKAVVQKTINLSTPKPARDKTNEPTASAHKSKQTGKKKSKGRGGPKGQAKGKRPSSGTSLADLLDPEVLAKLKGG